MAGNIPTPKRRFPRLPIGKATAELGQQIWASPNFSANVINGTTQFIFSVPIQSACQKLALRKYEILFQDKKNKWIGALEKAHRDAQIKKETCIKYIDVGLYKLFSEALLILSQDTEGFTDDYTEVMREQTIRFREASPRLRGRKSTPDRAKRLAKRFDILLPRIQALRKLVDSLKRIGIDGEEALREKVEKTFKDDWISFIVTGAAFETLPNDSSHDGRDISSTLGGNWAAWQLTVGVIRYEEVARTDRPLSALTVYRTVMKERKFRSQALSGSAQ